MRFSWLSPLLSLAVIFNALFGISQNTFLKTYSLPLDAIHTMDFIEDTDGNIIIAGNCDDKINGRGYPHILKINNMGVVIDSLSLNSLSINYCLMLKVFDFDSNYVFCGIAMDDFNSLSETIRIVYLKTTKGLVPQNLKTYQLPDTGAIPYMIGAKDNEGNILLTGYLAKSHLWTYGFIFKLTQNGDSLDSYFCSSDSITAYKDIFVDQDNSYHIPYYASNGRGILKYNSDLDSISSIPLPSEFALHYSIGVLLNSTYYIGTYGKPFNYPDRMGFVTKIQTSGLLLDSISFGLPGYFNYPTFQNSLEYAGGNLYFAGNSFLTILGNPYGDTPSRPYVAKLDTSMNIKWLSYFGNDAYYNARVIHATSDGGASLLLTRDDINDTIHRLDLTLIKMDSNGVATWTKDLDFNEVPKFRVYPNPAVHVIQIDLSASTRASAIRVYDPNGRLVFRDAIQGQGKEYQLTLQGFVPGLYFFEILGDGRRIGTGKFMKVE